MSRSQSFSKHPISSFPPMPKWHAEIYLNRNTPLLPLQSNVTTGVPTDALFNQYTIDFLFVFIFKALAGLYFLFFYFF